MLRTTARLLALGALATIVVPLSSCDIPKPPELPENAQPARVVLLEQGWTRQQRQWFHHASQGTSTIPVPYTWFVALERPEFSILSSGFLSDPEYLDRFGFIRGTRKPQDNPHGLPIGFARTAGADPISGKPMDQLGLTCAACHTARLDYEGNAIIVEGGPALVDLGKFRKALALSVGLTEKLPFRFARFAERVLGPERTDQQEKQLKVALGAFIKRVGEIQQREEQHASAEVEEGFGRLDALNRIGNEVFGSQLNRSANIVPRTAPVAYPHLWDTGWFDWVQYNGSIQQPMVRNAGEAMGVRGLVNFNPGAGQFRSTIPIDNLHRIETLLMGTPPLEQAAFNGLRAPRWPGSVLPPIDVDLARSGAALYRQHCQGCHLPPVGSAAFWKSGAGQGTPPHWSRKDDAGHALLRLPMIPLERIGTDPAQAADMVSRRVTVPASLGLTGELATDGADKTYAFADALGQTVEKVALYWYDNQKPPTSAADRKRMDGFRPNGLRDGIKRPDGTSLPAYKARPLDGIWATAPFLHNGSIPTLYHLLSPLNERPGVFYLGSREFDPEKVGFATGEIAGGFKFDTSRRGNWNKGHVFDGPANPGRRPPGVIGPRLEPDQRAALVEYLKTL